MTIGLVHGHLNLWISQYMQYYLSVEAFCWELKFVYCPTHEIHKIKCPTNINDFTVFNIVFCTQT